MAELSKLGRYQLKRVLGRGAMGVVYEGFDPTLGRRVAVKTILRNAAIDAETERAYSERFVREAKAVARLNHPHIVQVHDFGEENEIAFLVMEFIQGRELRSFFDEKAAFDIGEAVRIMGELLDALEFAHGAGVIHRDVKPANVMMDGQRRVKLTDFGVARVQDSERSAAGTMVGTPAFMSPEQISGGKVDRRSDIFSAGVILYQLLTGEQPFKGEGAWTVARKIMQEDPPQPSSLVTNISPAFDAIVERSLAKNPAQRFASAKEFAGALRAVAAGSPVGPGSAAITMPRPKAKAAPAASEAEVEFWRSIQNSNDAAEFEVYLEQFPEGTYAALARIKMAKLRDARAPDSQATVRLEAEAAERQRKEAEDKQRREAEEKARQEAEAKARREAEEQAKRAAEEARRAAQARADAEARARKVAEELAQRQAAEKAKREAEERARQAAALAKLKQQEVARKAAAADPEATVAQSRIAPAAASGEENKKSFAVPALVGAIVVIAGVAAFVALSRKPAPSPVAEAPAPVPSPAPKAEVSAADIERIRKETEERIRREYADKSAAEQAAAAKAASEKAIQEKQLAAKAAAEKLAADKAAAEKAAAEKARTEKLVAAKAADEKAALEKVAADKAAAEKAAADKAAAEKAAAEAAAAEKAAAEKAAAAKAAAAAKPGWPRAGDRWNYEVRELDGLQRRYPLTVEVVSVSGSQIRESVQSQFGGAMELNHGSAAVLTAIAPGIASLLPYLRAFREPRAGDRVTGVEQRRLWECGATLVCEHNVRIIGQEKVAVRAGSFDAWRIEVEFQVTSPNRSVGELTIWYSEQVKRTVKFQSRMRGASMRDPWLQPNSVMELVSYTPAK